MRIVLLSLLLPLATLQAAPAQEASSSNTPCVEVQIGQDRASYLDCLNAALARQVQQEHDTPAFQAPITAQSASNKVGLYNEAAARQRMGSNYGVSALPQRPQRSFTSPLLPGVH